MRFHGNEDKNYLIKPRITEFQLIGKRLTPQPRKVQITVWIYWLEMRLRFRKLKSDENNRRKVEALQKNMKPYSAAKYETPDGLLTTTLPGSMKKHQRWTITVRENWFKGLVQSFQRRFRRPRSLKEKFIKPFFFPIYTYLGGLWAEKIEKLTKLCSGRGTTITWSVWFPVKYNVLVNIWSWPLN